MRAKMKLGGGEGEGVKERVEAIRRSARVRIVFVTYNDNDTSQTRSPGSFTFIFNLLGIYQSQAESPKVQRL